jgi:hypothetical protein
MGDVESAELADSKESSKAVNGSAWSMGVFMGKLSLSDEAYYHGARGASSGLMEVGPK